MKFNFKAKTKTGEYKEGIINASSKELAVAILQKNNRLFSESKLKDFIPKD